ncbi:MAG: hypothetical protein WAW06_11510 [bacterium]
MKPDSDPTSVSSFVKDQQQEMETPFLDRYEPEGAEETGGTPAVASSVWQQLESPFVSQLEMESLEGEDPQARLYAQLLAELHDEEFDEVINNLVQEASAVYEDRISQEFGDPALQRAEAEEAVRDYLNPLVHATEELLETIAQGMTDRDVGAMSEEEVEEWFEQYEPSRSDLSPAFEDFLKGIVRKVKKVARGVAGLAKKGIKAATTIATGGLRLVLAKIKRLIRPLLNRVLKAAIGKLPPHLQPAARKVAKGLLGIGEGETAYECEAVEGEVTGAETDNIQREMDLQMADSLMAETMEESEAVLAEYETVPEVDRESESDVLQEARARFADRITQLPEGEDGRPALEEFIPAILPAMRLGMKIIGRPRVISFLARILAKMIGRFVGKEMAAPLSRAIVDTGLRMIAMEATEETETRVAGNAIASTVEETVQRIAALPESAFEDLELLEAYALDAFDEAAAANFPAEMIKPDLREASVNGTWVLMPANSKRKFYKKYTVVFDRVVKPEAASKITTFGGQPLATALRDQLGVDPSKEIKAKIHLYEAIPGTWLSRISSMERNVPGLGSPTAPAWSQIHPLTPEAAAALLGEPGLGRTVPDRFLQDRNMIDVGQRFYFLEIEGVRPPVYPRQRLRRSSAVYVKIDCPGNKISVALYLGERDAQAVSSKLRQNSPWPAVARGFTPLLNSVRRNFTMKRNVKIVHEAVTLEDYGGILSAVAKGAGRAVAGAMRAGTAARVAVGGVAAKAGLAIARVIPGALASVVAEKIIEWSLQKISEYLRERKQEFIKATELPADGVTILITFANPGLLPAVCRSLRGEAITLTSALIPRGTPSAKVQVFPGLRRG